MVYADQIILKLSHLPPVERQIRWILTWFDMAKAARINKAEGDTRPIIVDRSPFAGALYYPKDDISSALVIVRDLLQCHKMCIMTICMKDDSDLVKERIQHRLNDDLTSEDAAARDALSEFDDDYFKKMWRRFYIDYSYLFDFVGKYDEKTLLQTYEDYKDSLLVTPFTYGVDMERDW